jgi:hypothetical protein
MCDEPVLKRKRRHFGPCMPKTPDQIHGAPVL